MTDTQVSNCSGCGVSRGYARDMPTEKYPGVVEFFLASSLSPSQFWIENTTAALYRARQSAIAPSFDQPVPVVRRMISKASRRIRNEVRLGRRVGKRTIPRICCA